MLCCLQTEMTRRHLPSIQSQWREINCFPWVGRVGTLCLWKNRYCVFVLRFTDLMSFALTQMQVCVMRVNSITAANKHSWRSSCFMCTHWKTNPKQKVMKYLCRCYQQYIKENPSPQHIHARLHAWRTHTRRRAHGLRLDPLGHWPLFVSKCSQAGEWSKRALATKGHPCLAGDLHCQSWHQRCYYHINEIRSLVIAGWN